VTKRLFDLFWTIPGLIVLSPVMLLISLWIKLDSPGPVFFRQTRIGRYGKPFKVMKFRTMVVDAEKRGLRITVGCDRRITRAGHLLRQYKLDELPQLINVLLGEMSLVGPRPEVPEYVACYPDDIRDKVLSVKPGITDRASIEFRNENTLLSNAVDPSRTYREEILPVKLRYYLDYAEHRTLAADFRLILKTLVAILR
jgi:lipopolysaccharide/colanic/teichoic acid biosynthesis glycosyltransferase